MKLEKSTATRDEWDAYVESAETGSLFHTAWWHDAWDHPYRITILRQADGAIRAGVLLALQRFSGGMAMRRPPMTAFNDPVYDITVTARQARYTQHQQLLDALLDALPPSMRIHDFLLRPSPDTYLLPYVWRGYETGLGVSYVIPVAERESWRSGLAEHHRRALRRGHQELIERQARIEAGTAISEVLPVLFESARHRSFSPGRSAAAYERWWSAVIARGAGQTYVVRDDREVLAASLMVWDRRRAYNLASGIRTDLRVQTRAAALLTERMIEDAHGMGVDYDFEGSSLPGVEEFVRRWGGVLENRYRAVRFAGGLERVTWSLVRSLRGGSGQRPAARD